MTNMSSQNTSKINHLLKLWPRGTVAVQAWLTAQGISRQLADSYCQSNWLQRIYSGAYIQAGDAVDWTGGVYSLQQQLHLKIHVGGKTALEMQGLGHYVPMGSNANVWLYQSIEETRAFPRWFKAYFENSSRFELVKQQLFASNWDLGLEERKFTTYSILLSSPERAVIECLDGLPNRLSVPHAILLVEKLRTLRPSMLQQLLEQCTSVKAKRLFLCFAETQSHNWFAALDLKKVDLGKGNRMIGEGGHFIRKYGLSLPLCNNEDGEDGI